MISALNPTLHKALLAGTSRVALDKTPAELGACAEIGAMLPALAASPALLWHAIAANDLWQRAGFTAPDPSRAAASASGPAGTDERPPAAADARRCPPAAEHMLHLILRGIHPEFLETWLACAQKAQARLPHQFLVTLLEQGMNKPPLRALITPLLDARGHWLVAQHPDWTKRYGTVEAEDIDGQWQHGNLIDRTRALRELRQRDAAKARALLQADWDSAPPEDRAQLLPCLAVNLGLDDEAFLEQVLDDKRKEVRTAAITLLRSLSGSQLMQRCHTRLQALFTIERKSGLMAQVGGFLSALTNPGQAGTSQIELSLTLPPECEKAMKRDGIGAQKMTMLGEKAGWLFDLMRSVHPAIWCREWQLSPTQVLALLETQEYKSALQSGLAQAAASALQFAATPDNIEWFALLLNRMGNGWPGFDYAIVPEMMSHFKLLPEAQQETLLLGWLQRSGKPGASQRTAGVPSINPPQSMLNQWSQQRTSNAALSPALSRAFFSHAQQMLLAQNGEYAGEWEIRHRFKQMGEWLDISDLHYTGQGWPDSSWPHWSNWTEAIDKFQETLRFRHQLEASFLENAQ